MEQAQQRTALDAAAGALRVIVAPETWKATAYLLFTVVTGSFWFMVIVLGLSFGAGFLLVWVGVPILVASMLLWRVGAQAERSLLRAALDVDIATPYRPHAAGASVWTRLKTIAGDPATWKDCVYLMLLFPLGIVWFTVVVTLWSVAAALITLPAWYWALPSGHARLWESGGRDHVVVDAWWKAVIALLVGLVVVLLVPPILRAIARAHAWLARGLLGTNRKAELKRRMLAIETSRTRAVWSAEAERRRIERDLHDGAQARLVALAMTSAGPARSSRRTPTRPACSWSGHTRRARRRSRTSGTSRAASTLPFSATAGSTQPSPRSPQRRRLPLALEPEGRADHRSRGAAVRVVIAEDSVLLREGLARLLEDGEFEVVGSVGTGPDLVRAVERERPDVAVVDVRMPPTFTDEGLRAAIEARERVPETAIPVLSQYVEERYAVELVGRDAKGVGYLLKERVADVSDFLAALRRVADGGTALDPEVVAQLMGRRRKSSPLDGLTPREREVLALVAEGRSNTAIAKELVVTHGAVEKHVRNIFLKLGLPQAEDVRRRVLAALTHLEGRG